MLNVFMLLSGPYIPGAANFDGDEFCGGPHNVLGLYNLTSSIFQPFLYFCGRVEVELPLIGDKVLDFLKNPDRALDLHLCRDDVAKSLVLHWIHQVRQFLVDGDWLPHG